MIMNLKLKKQIIKLSKIHLKPLIFVMFERLLLIVLNKNSTNKLAEKHISIIPIS